MATIPTVPTEVPGNFNTAALWNANILGGIGYLLAPVRFKAYASVTQTLASTTSSTPILLDTEIVDSDGGHSTVTNTSRYVCQTAGLYSVYGSLCFVTAANGANSTGTRTVDIFVNSIGVTGAAIQAAASSANGTSVITATSVQLAVGDFVELVAWQNSGASIVNATNSNALMATMGLHRISS